MVEIACEWPSPRELEAAEKAKQIEGRVAKQVPAE
jgi:hypothetical protein